ncbi:MAG: putative orfan [Satyrvirus sp.]|uniref:Putative orfan n=1 Tax=Satyrvirus sp. TaxID=2487771 RepID=A0A3G5AEK7_9VIRU|nr:MAG: putative orfan [Satyrvirus sp.]
MPDEFVEYVNKYIVEIIVGFEIALYKMVLEKYPDKLKLLSSNHQPFITIFRDAHEKYYTSTYNSIAKKDNKHVVVIFDMLQKISGHSYSCLLNILANLIVSIHFNIDRKKLDYRKYESYLETLNEEINVTSSIAKINDLFNHKCSKTEQLNPLLHGEKFISIKLSTKEKGIEKEIKSFIN